LIHAFGHKATFAMLRDLQLALRTNFHKVYSEIQEIKAIVEISQRILQDFYEDVSDQGNITIKQVNGCD
jgi:hypothetical protein